jgi:threonine synthase
MRTFPYRLECSNCAAQYAPRQLHNLCTKCSGPLLVLYDISPAPELRVQTRMRSSTMWRFAEVLPVEDSDEVISIGEGSTPMLQSRVRPNLFIKDESKNPTRSFKSRGMAAAVTMAKNLGAKTLAAPTAGNAGAALSAYGARAGMPVFVAMPRDTPRSIVDECRSYGAEVELVAGVITDAGKRVQKYIAEKGGFDLSTLKEPYRIEGKKIMGYELLDDLGRLPDVILYPTGGGTGLIGMWKAFDEMQRLGWIGAERPRMFTVQSSGCAPIVRAFDQKLDTAPEWESPHTAAWGLRVPCSAHCATRTVARSPFPRMRSRGRQRSCGCAKASTPARKQGQRYSRTMRCERTGPSTTARPSCCSTPAATSTTDDSNPDIAR